MTRRDRGIQELVEKARKLDMQLSLTLKFMDQSPIIQRVTKMRPQEIEALPPEEREKLKNAVLYAINSAKEKANRTMRESNDQIISV